MLETISIDTLKAIFDTLPVDLTFVDNADTVRYYSRGDDRIFKRSPSVIGRKVQDCHPKSSLHKVEQVVTELKSGQKDVVEFWINLQGRVIYIRYFAIRNEQDKYLGILEVSQDITDLQKIEGEKRLLDEG